MSNEERSVPWMWSWEQQLNRRRSCCHGETAQGRAGEALLLLPGAPQQSCGFVNQDLVQPFLVSALGLDLAAASPEVSWNTILAVEGSCLLILLLVCGYDQTGEAGAGIQPYLTFSWTFQASAEPGGQDSMDPESLAWMGSPPTQHDWAGWWPVLRRRAGTNPECDAGLHREQGENSLVDAERWETQAWKTCA